MPQRSTLLAFAALITIVISVRVSLLNREFIVNSEGLSTGWVLTSARNHVRYGVPSSRGAGILNSGLVERENWVLYSHHPPLTPWTSAAVFQLAGVSERTARVVPAFCSIATTALLFWLVYRYYGLITALIAAIFYAFCPMTLALGDMAEYTNAPLVFFGVATVGAYLRWWESGGTGRLVLAAALFLLGALSDWPIFYLVPILASHALSTRRISLPAAAVGAAGAAGVLLVLAGWVIWSGADVSIWHQLSVRTQVEVTFRAWVKRVIVHHQGVLHTWPMLALSAVGVAGTVAALCRRCPGVVRENGLPLLLLAWGLMNLLVAVDGNYHHEWWSMPLTPGLAVTASLGTTLIGALPVFTRGRVLRPALLTGGVALFIVFSSLTARQFTQRTWMADEVNLKVLGTAIQRTSDPREGVLTSVSTQHPALWFYADRQLRPAITSVEALDAARAAGAYTLFFNYPQPDGPAPSWFVMPTAHQRRYPQLTATLEGRYVRSEGEGVVIYRLR